MALKVFNLNVLVFVLLGTHAVTSVVPGAMFLTISVKLIVGPFVMLGVLSTILFEVLGTSSTPSLGP